MTRTMLDERQMIVRSQITATSFALTLALTIFNGIFVDAYGRWGSGYEQAVGLAWVAITTLTIQSIWRGAYFSSPTQRRQTVVSLGAVIALFVLGAAVKLMFHHLSLWANGQAGNDFVPFLVLAYAVIALATTAARTAIDHRLEPEC